MKHLKLFASLIYMAALYVLSSLPGRGGAENALSSISPFLQNLLHVPAYGVLTLFWIFTLKAFGWAEGRALWGSISLVLLYGAVLELYQATVPGRYPSFGDVAFNFVGAVLFSAGYRFFKTSGLAFRFGMSKRC